MSEVEQIEQRIENLSPEDLGKLRAFAEFDARAWDDQIAADMRSGKLDSLIENALQDYKSGKARKL
jgi:hypothetical protein